MIPTTGCAKPHVVFRLDANARIGGGHAMRCRALADTLVNAGARISLAADADTFACADFMRPGMESLQLDVADGAAEIAQMRARWPAGCDWLVLDHYGRGRDFEQAAAGWARQRLVVDDLCARDHDCEIICDQTPGRRARDYLPWASAPTKVLAGARYALLRESIVAARRRPGHDASVRRQGPPRIVVSYGLTDIRGLAMTTLDGLAAAGFAGRVDVLIGRGAETLPDLQTRVAATELDVHLAIDSPRYAELVAAADIALSAAGVSCLELCCLGVPMLLAVVADNQQANAEGLVAAGAARSLGGWQDISSAGIAAAVTSLLADADARRLMADSGLNLVDGRGAARVAMAMMPARSSDGAEVLLRPALTDDVELVYRWQCHPETRRYARNPAVPTLSEHVAWMTRRLAMPHCLFSIVTCAGRPAGLVRLDGLPGAEGAPEQFEISILVAPDHYRRGIGRAALELARRLVPDADIHADVLDENVASHRLFQSAGYAPAEGARGYVQRAEGGAVSAP
ncbi:MAG: UDP-2,4-diacetamido-2,4,6-trideoxy-beta-L-altropyranose hydrolase [Gammaproteobacteria bacterium]